MAPKGGNREAAQQASGRASFGGRRRRARGVAVGGGACWGRARPLLIQAVPNRAHGLVGEAGHRQWARASPAGAPAARVPSLFTCVVWAPDVWGGPARLGARGGNREAAQQACGRAGCGGRQPWQPHLTTPRTRPVGQDRKLRSRDPNATSGPSRTCSRTLLFRRPGRGGCCISGVETSRSAIFQNISFVF